MNPSSLAVFFSLLLPFGLHSASAHPTVQVQNGFSIIMYQVGNKTAIQVEQDGIMRF